MVPILKLISGRLKAADRNALRRARLTHPDARPIPISELWAVLRNTHYRCVFCNSTIHRIFFLDHIIPLSKGGAHTLDNIQSVCMWCNSSKHNRKEPLLLSMCLYGAFSNGKEAAEPAE